MGEIQAYAIPGFQEPVSCFTHLFTIPIFLVAGFFLVRKGRGSWTRWLSLVVMVLATVFLLAMSGVYHLLGPGTGRDVMRQLDIAGVFALIAGTVTPVHAILFERWSRWIPLLFVWLVAAAGITLRAVFSESLPPAAGTAIFVILGWAGGISCVILWKRYGVSFTKPLIWGGVAYTIGAVILTMQWPTVIPGVVGPHELWHLAVLAGLGLHWKFVFQFASGQPDTKKAEFASTSSNSASTVASR